MWCEMAGVERVTVSLPDGLVREIDRRERNRSKFVAEAVRRELDRRRREELRLSLQNPHPETAESDGQDPEKWFGELPEEDAQQLVDSRAGKSVRWNPNVGWREDQA